MDMRINIAPKSVLPWNMERLIPENPPRNIKITAPRKMIVPTKPIKTVYAPNSRAKERQLFAPTMEDGTKSMISIVSPGENVALKSLSES